MTVRPHPRHALLLMVALLVALTGCATPGPVRGGPPDLGTPTSPAATESITESAPATPVKATAPKAPTVSYRVERKRQSVPFGSRVRRTDTLDRGTTRLARAGRTGLRVVVYRIKLRNGRPVGRERVRIEMVRRPVDKIVLRGTHVDPPPKPKPKPEPKVEPDPEPQDSCDPNYAGACVPIDSDVDCGGGSGNGPSYVDGTVTVVGQDVYGLDADGDGYGCE